MVMDKFPNKSLLNSWLKNINDINDNKNQIIMFQKPDDIFTSLLIRVLFITMGYLYVGYALTYYAIIQNSISYVMKFQDSSYKSEIEGFINAMLPVGAAIAALFSGNFFIKSQDQLQIS